MKSITLMAFAVASLAAALPKETPREGYMRRMAHRAERFGTSLPHPANTTHVGNHDSTAREAVLYNDNWSGAIVYDHGVSAVSAYIAVPNAGMSDGGNENTAYGGCAWVGIDGVGDCDHILQTGVDWYVYNGQVQYNAWYEWLPSYWTDSDFPISAGDQLFFSVQTSSSSSSTGGTATVNNLSNNLGSTEHFSGQPALVCQGSAEWIVEDYTTTQGSLVPFAEYNTVDFIGAEYSSSSGEGLHPSNDNAEIRYIEQNGQVLSQCSIPDENAVHCIYTG